MISLVYIMEVGNSSRDHDAAGPQGLTPLHRAAEEGNDEAVKKMLESGEIDDLNPVDELRRTPLHLAAGNNHTRVLKLLLAMQEERGVQVNARALFGITPLLLSVRRGCTEAVKLLLKNPFVDLEARSSAERFTVFHMAADSGREEMARLLLEKLLEKRSACSLSSLLGSSRSCLDCLSRTALHYAAREGHRELVKFFLQPLLADFVDANAGDSDKFTPLHLAARRGHVRVVDELLKSPRIDVNPRAKKQQSQHALLQLEVDMELELLPRPRLADAVAETVDGLTPLHLAAREGHKLVVAHLLMRKEIAVNAKDKHGFTPLHLAAERGRAEVVSLLLKNPHCNVNAEADDQSVPLHLAAKNGNISTVIELLGCKQHINCNAMDGSGATALDIAEKEGHINIVWLLLEHPVEVTQETGTEHLYSKQLELACELKHKEIVKMLLRRIADEVAFPGQQLQLPQQNSGGSGQNKKLLLHWAAKMGYTKLVQRISEWDPGWDVNLRDHLNQTPLHYAAEKGHLQIVKLLLLQPHVDVNVKNYRMETPLHLAAKEGHTDVVKELSLETSSQHLQATEEDKHERTALQLAVENGHKDIEKLLLERSDVQEYVNALYRDRQVYVDAANAILVGAALIASVTFAAWLQPPLGYTTYYGTQYMEQAPAPPQTYEVYAAIQQHPALQVFWIFNSLSFFLAIATVLSGAGGVLPTRQGFIKEAVAKVRRALLHTSILLASSVVFVLGAFATAGFVVLPPVAKYQLNMIFTICFGGTICSLFLAQFLLNLYELCPEWWR